MDESFHDHPLPDDIFARHGELIIARITVRNWARYEPERTGITQSKRGSRRLSSAR